MNVVVIGTAYPMRGGIAQFNAVLARALAERHTLTVLSFRRQYPGLLFPGKTQYVGPDDPAPAARIAAEPILDSLSPLSWWRTAQRARRARPEVIVFKYWMPFFAPCFGTVARWAKCGNAARVIFVCDNVIPHERTPLDLPLTRYALDAVDGCVVMSAAVRDDLLRIRPRMPWRLVPHPIYDIFGERSPAAQARAALGLGPGPLALFFGYVRPYKGLDVLLQALPEIRRHVPLRVIVAGEFYEGEERYRRMVADMDLGAAVIFRADYLPQDQVALHFSAADVAILPYRSATQSGIVQVAYHLDTPVICTDVGGLAEVVLDGRTGFVVPPDDPAALAAAVIRYYREEREAEFRAAVRQEKRKYSWAPLVAAIEELAAEAGARTGDTAR